ncbi:MAG: prepilin-type N-terminal cleavage/methylation domain-containing protein [Planctomycetota bacterium]
MRRTRRQLQLRLARGYTLLELLVVIAIVMLLLGMGVGVVAKLGKRNELEATTNSVRALVRRARNAAREERAPAVVELDVDGGEVRSVTRETLTLFRFEGDQLSGAISYAGSSDDDAAKSSGTKAKLPEYEIRGSYSVMGTVVGADSIDGGKLGSALEFRRPGSCVMLQDRPSLSPIEGVAVEAWVLPARLEDSIPKRSDDRDTKSAEVERRIKAAGTPPTATPVRSMQAWDRRPEDPPLFTVVRKGKAFEVAITAGYAVQVAITGPIGRTGGETTYVARTEDLALRPDKWARIALAFDGRELSCAIDGLRKVLIPVKGFETQPERLLRDRAPLVFSDPDPERGFVGLVDEVKLSGILRLERVTIPKNMALLTATAEIRFDALGGLDPLRHPEPVVFWLSDHEEALKTLEPPAPEPNKTAEKKKPDAEAKGATDRAKQAKFADLVSKLPDGRVHKVAVELTGIVTGVGR